MEIIDTFRKALKLQIHTLLFIFPTKKFKTLRLSRNCLSTLQFSFRHTFLPPQLWRVFFPTPNKETGSPGRDLAAQISCSLGGSEESQRLTQARHTLRCLFAARLGKEAHPSPGHVGLGRMHSVDAAPSTHSGFFLRAGTKLELSCRQCHHRVLPLIAVTMPIVVTLLIIQGSLIVKHLGTPLIFPAPRECTQC